MFIFNTLMLLLNGIDIPEGRIKAIDIKKRVASLFAGWRITNVKFNIERTDSLEDEDYTIAGFYLEELQKIEIVLIIPKKAKGYLNIDNPNLFRFHVAQTIQHEFIHHQQFLKRDELQTNSFSLCMRGNSEQKYLGERDEIDAYSYDIAIEVNTYGWDESQTLKIYRKQFQPDHPVMKRLLKKAYLNLGVLNGRKT
jgi:hypothetical protein